MRPMKTQGLVNVQELLARTRKLRAMRRIGASDAEFIEGKLQEVEARIVSMYETDESGEEVL